jgi:pantoate--beta-alanine ligase
MPDLPLPVARCAPGGDLAAQVSHGAGERVALVPTMGALHEGHLSLVQLAQTQARRVVASVFVNPKQFGPNEDFDAYPRGEARDAEQLASVGCDLMFAPSVAEMYPQGFSSKVSVSGLSEPLDGGARPGHFDGVATIVTKLLLQCGPDLAIFGEKDYQQLLVIKRFVRDLDIPVEIVGAPTARLEDGLARSSRNAYLTEPQRAVAGKLNLVLREAVRRLKAGEPATQVEAAGLAALKSAGFERIDYFEVRGAEDLSRPATGPARVFAAAVIGKARLIDNMAVE